MRNLGRTRESRLALLCSLSFQPRMALSTPPHQATAEPSSSILPSTSTHSVSDDSDSDAVNTSNAKVYFGRFQTPEKKIASLMNSAQAHSSEPELKSRHTRPRRSPRLSTPPRDLNEIAPGVQVATDQEAESDAEPQTSHVADAWIEAPLPEFLREDGA